MTLIIKTKYHLNV